MRLKTFIGKAYRWLLREPMKKVNRIRYKMWLSFKQVSFKDRQEKIERVDKVLSQNPNIYFTVDLVKTGFTDQLMGFDFLYKTGKGLGLKYYHTPLSAHRSSDPFLYDPITQKNRRESSKKDQKEFNDIFDFLGINDYLQSQSEDVSKPRKEYYLNLNEILYGREGIDSYDSLIEEMKVLLYPFLHQNKKIILCFFAQPQTYFHYYRYSYDQKEHQIDYYSCFKEFGGRWDSEFKSDTTNMLVHIRQGDTGTVETPWNTFIPVWYEIEGKFTQFKNEKDIPGIKRMYPNQFYQFVRDFQNSFAGDELSTAVFSDGYKKAFRWIYLYARENDISEKEIEKLKKLEPTYDELQFGKFNDLPKTSSVIGEEVEKLYRLVQSFFDADIIITGTQAVMMPKFMTTYGDKDRMPLLILLYHTQQPHLSFLGLNHSEPFILFVDVNNYNISEIVDQAEKYLQSLK